MLIKITKHIIEITITVIDENVIKNNPIVIRVTATITIKKKDISK